MKGLKDTLANLSRLRDRFERLLSSAVKRGGGQPSVPGRLREVVGFGTNPGNLRMLAYVPKDLAKPRALVVALHTSPAPDFTAKRMLGTLLLCAVTVARGALHRSHCAAV